MAIQVPDYRVPCRVQQSQRRAAVHFSNGISSMMYVFGGSDETGAFCGDLLEFDFGMIHWNGASYMTAQCGHVRFHRTFCWYKNSAHQYYLMDGWMIGQWRGSCRGDGVPWAKKGGRVWDRPPFPQCSGLQRQNVHLWYACCYTSSQSTTFINSRCPHALPSATYHHCHYCVSYHR